MGVCILAQEAVGQIANLSSRGVSMNLANWRSRRLEREYREFTNDANTSQRNSRYSLIRVIGVEDFQIPNRLRLTENLYCQKPQTRL